MIGNSFINLDDLYSVHLRRDKKKLKFYDEIYQKIIHKIKKTNNDFRALETFYQVPPFVLGGPMYDYDDLKNYLQFKLSSNGLFAEYIDYNTLYISWKPTDIDRRKYEKNLEKIKQDLERKYNVSEDKIYEKPVQRRKNNITANQTQVGVLQYNDKTKDYIPVNPKKIKKNSPLDNFPMAPRYNYTRTMANSQALHDY